jgi:hypothetical protein
MIGHFLTLIAANALTPNGPSDIGLPQVGIDSGIKTILSVVFAIIGGISVVYIVIGGLKYTVSGGDAAGVKKAKETITYALVGLIVAFLAFGAVNFITTQANNVVNTK